ncbi:hypothetical protein RT0505 [Rickettsia typhi str. Wilmington]|uniref:Uncharacterized protein n=1 Tax=Rickettsia typhi (strain ATCC VR-144 / Wilmington) TaxID=257363 RepID=Q68WL6_RICTY|nr:hypothetical protein RT0505 [Rickettsia typhi str. Wilmington]
MENTFAVYINYKCDNTSSNVLYFDQMHQVLIDMWYKILKMDAAC